MRSQQTVESINGQTPTPPAGVPGAASNQPPVPSTAPINGPAPTLAAAGQTPGAAGTASSKKESITNYEVDKTVQVVKGASGLVKRINAAVVVNHYVKTDDKGKTTSTPLTPAEIEKMTALVQEAVGYNKDRGDSVNLMNAPFVAEKSDQGDVPLWRQPEVLDTLRSFAWPLGTLALGAIVLLGVIRPALKGLTQPAGAQQLNALDEPGGQLDALEAEQPDRPQLSAPGTGVQVAAPTQSEARMEEARKLTRDNPAAVANIVKAWINGEAPA